MRENGPLVLLVSLLTVLGVRGLSSVPSAPAERPGESKARLAEQGPSDQDDSGRPFWGPLEDFRNTGRKGEKL